MKYNVDGYFGIGGINENWEVGCTKVSMWCWDK